jgi:hypothetical protein
MSGLLFLAKHEFACPLKRSEGGILVGGTFPSALVTCFAIFFLRHGQVIFENHYLQNNIYLLILISIRHGVDEYAADRYRAFRIQPP